MLQVSTALWELAIMHQQMEPLVTSALLVPTVPSVPRNTTTVQMEPTPITPGLQSATYAQRAISAQTETELISVSQDSSAPRALEQTCSLAQPALTTPLMVWDKKLTVHNVLAGNTACYRDRQLLLQTVMKDTIVNQVIGSTVKSQYLKVKVPFNPIALKMAKTL